MTPWSQPGRTRTEPPRIEDVDHLTMMFLRDLFARPTVPTVVVDEPSNGCAMRRIQRFAGRVRSVKRPQAITLTLNGVTQTVETAERQDENGSCLAWSCWAELDATSDDVVLEVAVDGVCTARQAFRRIPFDDRRDAPLHLLQHIPKTAGTSLRAALEEHATIRMLGLYPDPAFMKPQDANRLSASGFDDLDVVFGHFHHGLHRHTHRECRYVTILRHPADLIRSYYLFMKYQTGAYARHDTIEDAFTDEYAAFDNVITRYVAGVSPCTPIGGDVAAEAMGNLETDYAFVGTTDDMPGSLQAIGDLLGIKLAGFNLNITPRSPEDGALSRGWIMERFAPYLKYELEVYSLANRKFAAGRTCVDRSKT